MKVLITDPIAPICPNLLQEAGLEVEYRPGLPPAELVALIPEYDALVVRSGTKVTEEVIAAGDRLKVIGRAGVGVDNIDLEAATERGIAVVNAPGGNTISTAEHTIALMLALARNIPQSNRSLLEGRWERSKFKGVEVYGKTLGVIGFGRIGREVARRARALGMRVVAYDPLIPASVFEAEDVESQTLEGLLKQADFVTLHVPKDPSTHHMINEETLAGCKQGVRIINCSRGGVVDEAALLRALESGHVAGAALDVFEQEPPGDAPLLRHPHVVATCHLGAATVEAQERVAEEVAREVVRYLREGDSANVVNRAALTGSAVPSGVQH